MRGRVRQRRRDRRGARNGGRPAGGARAVRRGRAGRIEGRGDRLLAVARVGLRRSSRLRARARRQADARAVVLRHPCRVRREWRGDRVDRARSGVAERRGARDPCGDAAARRGPARRARRDRVAAGASSARRLSGDRIGGGGGGERRGNRRRGVGPDAVTP
ncbi:metal ion transporter, nramp family [Burkholderia pseudomallei]|nr:metal ion transporter, nramp family [Burkholderia pseudomallei]